MTFMMSYESIYMYLISLIHQYLASIIYKPPKYQRWMITRQYWNNQCYASGELLVHKYKVRKKTRRRKKYSLKGSLERVIQHGDVTVASEKGFQYHHKHTLKGSNRLSNQVEFVLQGKHGDDDTSYTLYKWFRRITVPLSIFMTTYCGNVSSCLLRPTYYQTNICLDSGYDEDEAGQFHALRVDSDSIPIRIDNCCTRSISYDKEDFLPSSLRPVSQCYVKGFGGSTTPITHKGTLIWKMLDDTGQSHGITIPDSLLVPTAKIRLLSPQHWAQSAKADCSPMHPVSCTTLDDQCPSRGTEESTPKPFTWTQEAVTPLPYGPNLVVMRI
jgi:hypothetical protein